MLRGFLDHARTRKTDERLRLGYDHVTQRRVAGHHASRGWVREDRDVGQSGLGVQRERAACLGELHEAENALVHPRAAGCGDNDRRNLQLGGLLNRPRNFFPDNRAHTGAEEAEVHYCQRRIVTVELAEADHHGVVHARLALVRAQPLRIGGHSREFQHIHTCHVGIELAEGADVVMPELGGRELAEGALIGQHRDTFRGGHREVVIALTADFRVGREFLAEDDLAARLALHPQSAGDLMFLRLGLRNLWLFFFFEYRHDEPPRSNSQGSRHLLPPRT